MRLSSPMHANLLPSGFALNNFSRAELPAAAAATQQLGDARKQKMMMIRCMTFNVLARKHTHTTIGDSTTQGRTSQRIQHKHAKDMKSQLKRLPMQSLTSFCCKSVMLISLRNRISRLITVFSSEVTMPGLAQLYWSSIPFLCGIGNIEGAAA